MSFLQGNAVVVLGTANSGGTITLAAGTLYAVTSGGQTITLPASPNAGDVVAIASGNFSNTIVGRNAQTIMQLANNLVIDVPNTTVTFIYSGNTTIGWVVL